MNLPKPLDTVVHHEGGGVSFRGYNAVHLFALLQLKMGLKLEIDCPGLKFSRHGSALKFAKTHTGLKTHDRAAHLARVEILIEACNARLIHVTKGDDTP